MNHQTLDDLSRKMLAAAITGGEWIDHLETMMETMDALGGGPARIALPDVFGIPTRGVQASMRDYGRVDHPPLMRHLLIPASAGEGFVADYTTAVHEARRRHPFYTEFLCPRGLHHQATAFLDETDVGCLRLLVFRDRRQGRFEPEEIETLTRHLPYLRSVAMISRATLDGAARRQAEPFERRGEPVFYLDPGGSVLETNAGADRVLGHAITTVKRRLATIWPLDQPRLDQAVAAALDGEKPSLVSLRGDDHASATMALVLPVSGEAKDVFCSTAAVVVLIDPSRRHHQDVHAAVALLGTAAGLTARELDVVRLVGSGSTPRAAADDLSIGYGTLRCYLKVAFGKLGVHSQAELVALLKRLH